MQVSPVDVATITGFSLVAATDASNTYSTSAQVVGKVYAADYLQTTPDMMTSAISDMETAYTDAANRTRNSGRTNIGGGSIGGLTLTPGTFTWTTNVDIASNITLSENERDGPCGVRDLNACCFTLPCTAVSQLLSTSSCLSCLTPISKTQVFIFQAEMNLVIGSNVAVLLEGGVRAEVRTLPSFQFVCSTVITTFSRTVFSTLLISTIILAQNIFWQVAGLVAVGTGAHMEG
jgi:hypothetical protein